MITGGCKKNLGLMLETTKGFGMKDTITVALINRAQIAGVQLFAETSP